MKQRLNGIKKFERKEVDAYVAFIRLAFGVEAKRLGIDKATFPSYGAFLTKDKLLQAVDSGLLLWGYYVEDQVIGTVGLSKKSNERFQLEKLAVDPSERGKGLGRQLLHFAEHYALGQGGVKLSLGMVLENRLLYDWYLKQGFESKKEKLNNKFPFGLSFMEKQLQRMDEAPVREQRPILKAVDHCAGCGLPVAVCSCMDVPKLRSDIHFVLLTHSNELKRPTNTGKLIENALPQNTHLFEWHRKVPPLGLLEMIASGDYEPYVVFPQGAVDLELNYREAVSEPSKDKKILFILIDGTWQEAKKIMRKSDYLKSLSIISLHIDHQTGYKLRRGSDLGHLCTAEVAVELLRQYGSKQNAANFQTYFEKYMTKFLAGRSGHVVE